LGITVDLKDGKVDLLLKHAVIFNQENKKKEALECYKAAYNLSPSVGIAYLIRESEQSVNG